MKEDKNPEWLKKFQELEERISTSSFLAFSYIQAMLSLLNEKGIADGEEFQVHLEKARKELAEMMKDAEFFRMMGGMEGKAPGSPNSFQDEPPEAEK